MLLSLGIAPAIASASIHLAEVATTAASGLSHLRFGNVNRPLLKKLILPGAIGAFAGATFLSHLTGNYVRLYVSIFLLSLGLFILAQFFLIDKKKVSKPRARPITNRFCIPLGFLGGFFDASGGGGWGPIATPALLAQRGLEPRVVIGTVSASEFVVATSASLGFLISLGFTNINWTWAGAIALGGVFAAPIAAWIVKNLPTRLLASLVSGMLIMTNVHTILGYTSLSSLTKTLILAMLICLWIPLTFRVIAQERQERKQKEKLIEAAPLGKTS